MLFSDGVLIYLCLVSLTSASPARLPTEPAGLTSTAMSSYGKRGAVATEVKQCSDLGVELIKKGGNAADAVSLPLSLAFVCD